VLASLFLLRKLADHFSLIVEKLQGSPSIGRHGHHDPVSSVGTLQLQR